MPTQPKTGFTKIIKLTGKKADAIRAMMKKGAGGAGPIAIPKRACANCPRKLGKAKLKSCKVTIGAHTLTLTCEY